MATALKLRGRHEAWCLRRVAILDDGPVALLTAWLPASLAKGMAEHDLGEGSLYDALAAVHGVEIPRPTTSSRSAGRASRTLTCSPSRRGARLLEVVGVTRDQKERPVDSCRVLDGPEHSGSPSRAG